jgi:hypothetical protein
MDVLKRKTIKQAVEDKNVERKTGGRNSRQREKRA